MNDNEIIVEQAVTPTATPELVLDATQEKAVALCCNLKERLCAVTGDAGTGKTTIMKKVYNTLTDSGYSVVLAAPTGKAARRIREATGIPAVTIHRLLEYTHPGDRDEKTGKVLGFSVPKRWRENPCDQDVLLIDEYSMVNREIHRNLFEALRPGGCIRVFGDIHQLPPIEKHIDDKKKPSPFQQIMNRFPTVVLETIHRQGEGSGIVSNGRRILTGFCPSEKPDFKIIVTEKPVERLKDVVMLARTDGIDYSSLDHQIITLMNKSHVGTSALNQALHNVLSDDMKPWIPIPRNKWEPNKHQNMRVDDKVVQVNNDYQLGIFNGETGIIREIYPEGGMDIDFGDRMVNVPAWLEYLGRDGKMKGYDPRKELYLAYVLTTHKAQGSEYKHVIYIMNKSMSVMQCRANFYTGITRARKHVTLITDARSLSYSVVHRLGRII